MKEKKTLNVEGNSFEVLAKLVSEQELFYDFLNELSVEEVNFKRGSNDSKYYIKIPLHMVEEDKEELKDRIILMLVSFGLTHQNRAKYNRWNYKELNEYFGLNFKDKEYKELLVGNYGAYQITHVNRQGFKVIINKYELMNGNVPTEQIQEQPRIIEKVKEENNLVKLINDKKDIEQKIFTIRGTDRDFLTNTTYKELHEQLKKINNEIEKAKEW